MKNPTRRSIRIIGGKYKKSRIPTINTTKTRPTTNYMRETLFNWIGNKKIKISHCLDCFSGSGALGIEAVSRHALSSTCIEIQKNNVFLLKKIILKLSITNIYVINTNAIQWLKKPQTSFDIIFLDPPFRTTLLTQTIFLLQKNNWLKHNALIYIEQEKKITKLSVPNNWILQREKKTHRVHYSLFIHKKN